MTINTPFPIYLAKSIDDGSKRLPGIKAFFTLLENHLNGIYASEDFASVTTAIDLTTPIASDNALRYGFNSEAQAIGYSGGFAANHRFQALNGAIIETTASLEAMMSQTDIGDIPVRAIIPPFDATYINFSAPIPLELTPGQSIAGAYIFKRGDGLNNLTIEAAMILSRDDMQALRYVVKADFDDMNLSEGLLAKFKHINDTESENSEYQRRTNEMIDKAVPLIMKTLVYMGLKDARIVNHVADKLSAARIALASPKKRKQLQAKAGKPYPYIEVGPEKIQDDQDQYLSDGSGHKAIHWRRGHFRNQACGAGLIDHKIIWLQPMLINANKLAEGEAAPAPKRYRVGG